MGEWMVGAIHIDDLREQIEDNIDLLGRLKDTDNSIAKINTGLSRLFSDVSTKDIIVKEGITNELDKLFDELNKTGFMRARKFGLVYNPYKIRFKKNKKKANIMKAELATKTVTPSISRELRIEKSETAPHGATLRGGSEEEAGKTSDARIVAYRSEIIEQAHGQWIIADRLARKLFDESLPEPKYTFLERAKDENAGYETLALYVIPINTVEFNDAALLPIYEHQRNTKYESIGEKVLAVAFGYEQIIGHELAHAITNKLLSSKHSIERTQLSEALADLIGTYIAVENRSSFKRSDAAGAFLLVKVASNLKRNAIAIKEYSESAKRAIEKGTDYTSVSVALERLLNATDNGNFRLDLLYRNPQIAISTAILQTGVKSEDDLVKFIRDITRNPFAFEPLKNVLGEDALNKQFNEILKAIGADSVRSLASFETELNKAMKARDLEKPKTIIQKFVATFVPKPTKPLDLKQIDKKAKFTAIIQKAETMVSKFDNMVEKANAVLEAHGYASI